MKEIEIKIKIGSKFNPKDFNEELKIIKSTFVRDVYYDTINASLLQDDKVLRIRTKGEQTKIAFKGAREKNDSFMIMRDEFETVVLDSAIIEKIILSLGYIKRDVVEKNRTLLQSTFYPDLKITLDDYPFIGSYIEIEGNKIDINAFCNRYKINMSSLEMKNCTESFLEYCNDNALKFENPRIHFTFKDEQNLLNE